MDFSEDRLSEMFSRYLRPYVPPPRRRWYRGGSRYNPRYSAFDPWAGHRFRYGNSRRRRFRRRPNFRFRDRFYYRPGTIPETPKEEEPEEPEPPSEEVLKVLHVEDVDFHIAENTRAHRTDKYDKTQDRVSDDGEKENGELVIRRGKEFLITLNMDRPYNKEKDDLRLVFRIGDTPLPNKGTEIVIRVNEKSYSSIPDITAWRASIQSIRGNDVKLSVYPAVNSIIGEWDFAVQTVLSQQDGTDKVFEYDEPDNVYILLNPFCRDDIVYMDTQDLLDEYILNDQGCQWYGAYTKPRARPWFFGQFEDGILDASLHLLRKGYGLEITKEMSNPVMISRMLSKMVNNCDDNGVLVGNWSGVYDDGQRPTSWSGSEAILKQYMETKEPVKYGQCWVFSGLLTTVCRALGLPCRSITNFESAHDTDASATIDKYFKIENGRRIELRGMASDSIWNFHVWNEVWMSRADLPKGYDGWQAIDATPQETSEGMFQCGPSPVAAIRKGHLWLPHDSPFVFAEVNANVVYHEVTLGGLKVAEVNKKKVGKKLSTKAPNGRPLQMHFGIGDHPDRLDCTHLYKPPDGSNDEKLVLETVARYVGNIGNFEGVDQGISVFIDNLETVMVGSNFEIRSHVQNVSRVRSTVDITITVKMIKYTGAELEIIKSLSFLGELLRSGESKLLTVSISVEDYLEKLHGEDGMRVEVAGKVRENDESFMKEEEFTFDHPDIIVTPRGPYIIDKPFEVLLEVENPLSVPLTELSLRLEGPGLRSSGKIIRPKQTTVPALGKFSETISLTPRKAGNRAIIANFDCKELPDITGQVEIDVPPIDVINENMHADVTVHT
ncbi:hemocyte protein-glutamine gamma-glutamyltransferase-like [Liolophura sinensis]|uniref:hemocyte protein-glutamine gamma-glutamyltransferase-like n=1 Tax=Liolophura sinensis TaxID=3198878 RepID=UPI0031590992